MAYNMCKNYYYKGFRYFYDFHYKKWIIEVDGLLQAGYNEYLDRKEQVKPFIDYLAEKREAEKKQLEELDKRS